MARSLKFLFLIVSLAMSGLLVAACDSGTQEPDAPTAKPLNIEQSDAAESVDVSNSGFPESRYPENLPEGIRGVLPDTLPDDLPLYPGSAPAQGRGVEVEGVPMAALQLLTMDPPETVYEFYREKFVSNGWELEERDNSRGKNAISASNGKCKASMLVAPTDDGGSDIFLVTEC